MAKHHSAPAGEYELVVDQWNVYDTNQRGEVVAHHRYVKGDIVKLDKAQATRMIGSKVVCRPGELAAANAARLEAQARRLRERADEAKAKAREATGAVKGAGQPDDADQGQDQGDGGKGKG